MHRDVNAGFNFLKTGQPARCTTSAHRAMSHPPHMAPMPHAVRGIDVKAVWEDLDNQERELKREAVTLREIWHKTTEMHAKNKEKREEFEKKANQHFLPADARVVLNVGGQIFETTAGVLCRDRWSVLAALCEENQKLLKAEPDGSYFLDRDWWVFRHILQWLRSGDLPNDPMVLMEMYNEANFYRLQSLATAIRELPGDPEERFAGC